MKYKSTRDCSQAPVLISSAQAIKKGLAPDGGLYMPCEIPKITKNDIDSLCKCTYDSRAAQILSMFLDDYGINRLSQDCVTAYSGDRFPGGAAPLVKIKDGVYSLELWHGPTCAFKDMALQIMPRLLSGALKLTDEKQTAHILVATSGDTGKAALEGYKDVEGVKITVFYPEDGVSRMQKMQMTTQEGSNVYVCAVEGNFDDAQTGVKQIFSDKQLSKKASEEGFFFSSANSINWGRLVPQIVYYISAYCDLINSGDISYGDQINFCVPTGNFGNIFAAYIAREMGLPIGRLICASNSNCVLTDFINTGTYNKTREFFKTISPSMDILISSNLERLLYILGGSELTSDLMRALKETGSYSVPNEILKEIRKIFSGYCCSEEETSNTISNTFNNYGYVLDPHTAVGFASLEKYVQDSGDKRKTVLVSTASPYKFAADVCKALKIRADSDEPSAIFSTLEEATGTKAPDPLTKMLSLPVRFKRVVKPCDMKNIPFEV